MNRVVVILGAGCSMQYFDPPLTTDAITSAVCDEKKWADIINCYHHIAQDANTIEEQAIRDILKQLKVLIPTRNFEDYAEVIDKIASYEFDLPKDKISHTVIKLFQGQYRHYSGHAWTAVPFLFRQLIAEYIGEKHKDNQVSNYQEMARKLGQFFQYLIRISELSIFSLNYDDVILDSLESVGLALEDGFSRDYFSAKNFLKGNNILAFPHGHARFILNRKGLRKCINIPSANRDRLNNLYGGLEAETTYIINGQNCYNFNTFITTGRDKDDSFNYNPYAAYYQRLAYDLLKAKSVVVIGFSLQDPHICRLLHNFLILHPDNHLLVVDYDSKPVNMIEGFTDEDSLIFRIFEAVDIHSIPMKGNLARLNYAGQEGIDKLNSTGCGKIHPQIYICKLGLEKFLINHNSILAEACSL